MATITIEIKEGYEIAIGKAFGGLSYAEDREPSSEEHLAAIESKIYELFEPYYKEAVKQDPEVIAKRAEYEAIVNQKLAETKGKK